ncbi:MAG: RND family efflux system, membrane fusion protein [uncultured Campylobacterales bacterium]|uniref:RND family efflux system, membrane fusion protein n=1 Tax=uncultured Campylobacterales bacterium TaxID=352960 RepID=A0A6S6S7F9_9BACT|nr:MAG: RND family efflux system, membrane fusion protein [uncultured Campylobacterales bacterium]
MFKKLFIIMLPGFILCAAPASLVELTSLKKGQINPLVRFVGSVMYSQKSEIASQSSGIITKVNFEIGDEVKKGQVLAHIDSELLDAKMQSLKANLATMKDEERSSYKDISRYKKLFASGSVTQKEYENMELKYSSAKNMSIVSNANLKELQIQKNQKIIKAPYSGVIVSKDINLAEWVKDGSKIATIVDTNNLEIVVNVPIDFVNELDKSKEYDIEIGSKIYKASLKGAIPSGDKLTRTLPVIFKVTLKDVFTYEGQEASIELAKNIQKEVILVKRDAVIKKFGQDVVFVVDDNLIAIMTPVKILGYDGAYIGISAPNLSEKTKVILKGNERVFPNSPVKVINEASK